ncbi:MAG: transketolase, partial [Bacteroidetes bacterium]|nr:transketolase [Bacteroidota bacterium]
SEQREACLILERLSQQSVNGQVIRNQKVGLEKTLAPIRMDTVSTVKKILRLVRDEKVEAKTELQQWLEKTMEINYDRYSSYLYSQSPESALNISEIKPVYSEQSKLVDGREVLRANFDAALTNDPRVVAFGEDVGRIGDVNQAFAGLQKKHGELRVMDTGIRESAIIGEGIGLAMRGLKPIAEIQYLDYLIYAIQTLSDDLSTLQYRTKGGQKAPLIIRTRGHRLEGVWHSGSPMGMILGSLRGIYVLVPRDMTRAAGFYNTMLRSDDPALIIECLNGYRLKERMPDNIGEFTIPLGIPEVIREGTDVTVVTYGSMCRLVMEAAEQLKEFGISCEVLDVQTLLPFDSEFRILESVKKTNRVVFADEDVPGGATAFMLNHFIEKQKGYYFLDSPPATISAKEHRPAYSSDGDYFSKPNIEEIFDRIYDLMSEVDPNQYPDLYLS